MSAREWLIASMMAHLAENAALDPLTVFDLVPSRAAIPYAVVEEPVLVERGAALMIGREARIAVSFVDAGERPARLRLLQGRLEEQVLTLPGDLGGEGWRIGGLSLARSRIARGRDRRWLGMSEFVALVWRAQ